LYVDTYLHHSLQTVILDCCHSSNALRSGDVVPNFRNINDPPPLSQADLRLPGGGIGTLSQGKSLECSVLLAACRRDERAGENSSGGLFTQALLKHLEGVGNSGQNWPTYRQLIQSLNISERCVLFIAFCSPIEGISVNIPTAKV